MKKKLLDQANLEPRRGHDLLRPGRLIRLDRLKDKQQLKLHASDILSLGSLTFDELLSYARFIPDFEPGEGVTIEVWPWQIDFESSVAARATCFGLPEDYCGVGVSGAFDPDLGELVYSFGCSCDFGDLTKPVPPNCQISLTIRGFTCTNNGGCRGNCQLVWGRVSLASFGIRCECN